MLTIALDPDRAEISIEEVARRRPARVVTHCFECEESLVAVLGSEMRHHFRHQSKSACPVAISGGEGERHLMAKLRLRAALQSLADENGSIEGRKVCACAREGRGPIVAMRAGDSVVLEKQTADAYRPDISVVRDGTLCAALEVVVSHKSEHEKWRRLNELNVPVIELPARDVIDMEGALIWRPVEPRDPGWRVTKAAMDFVCDGCRARDHEWRTVPKLVPIAATRQERYHPDGTRLWFVFVLVRVTLAGEATGARLFVSKFGKIQEWSASESHDESKLRELAREASMKWAAKIAKPPGTIVESSRLDPCLVGTAGRGWVVEYATQKWWWNGRRWARGYSRGSIPDRFPLRHDHIRRLQHSAKVFFAAPEKGLPNEWVLDAADVDRFAAKLVKLEVATGFRPPPKKP